MNSNTTINNFLQTIESFERNGWNGSTSFYYAGKKGSESFN
jgi:hypothetical protein